MFCVFGRATECSMSWDRLYDVLSWGGLQNVLCLGIGYRMFCVLG